jgi:hypothetical protein
VNPLADEFKLSTILAASNHSSRVRLCELVSI